MRAIRSIWQDTRGATMSEYAIALCVVAVATVVAIQLFSGQIGGAFERSSSNLSAR